MECSESVNRVAVALRRDGGFLLDASFDLPTEGITAIFGPSGSGKTTLLRSVAGLEKAEGLVRIGGVVWQDSSSGIFLPVYERQLGYVFQEASLFPHLSAEKNLAFAIKRSKSSRSQERLENAIELLGIRHLLKRMPNELSGGERQRVAIARATATDPKIMLFDEPLAALDFARKAEILPWLQRLKSELKIPMLYVTHSAEEVIKLADHIAVFEEGKMKAFGSLQDVLGNIRIPVDLGGDYGVVIKGVISGKDTKWHLQTVRSKGLSLTIPESTHPVGAEVTVRLLAKEVALSLAPLTQSSYRNCLKGKIVDMAEMPDKTNVLVKLECSGEVIVSMVTRKAASDLDLKIGKEMYGLVKAVLLVDF